jgi:hypothetical protein
VGWFEILCYARGGCEDTRNDHRTLRITQQGGSGGLFLPGLPVLGTLEGGCNQDVEKIDGVVHRHIVFLV